MKPRLLVLAAVVTALSPAVADAAPRWSAPVDVIPGNGLGAGAPQALVSGATGKSLILAGSGPDALLATGTAAGIFASAVPIATASSGNVGLDSALGPDGTVAVAWAAAGAGHVTIVKPGGDVLTQADLPGTGVPTGRAGAHQLRNDSDQPVSLLIVSTMAAPEINLFPDTNELWIRDYIPGTDAPDDAIDLHAPLPADG
jgi:hypothetical protein